MTSRAGDTLPVAEISIPLAYRRGNLVCPASYDLGEDLRFVAVSVTEGEDKPLKYPTIFNSADVALVTKLDPANAVGFDRAAADANIQAVRPGMEVIRLSARTGDGMDEFLGLLERHLADTRAGRIAGSAP